MYFDIKFAWETLFKICGGIPISLSVTFGSLILAFPFGLLMAIAKVKKVRILSPLISVFISFVRGTPLVVQIFILYSGIPRIINYICQNLHWDVDVYGINALVYAFVVFGVNTTAIFCEVFRSALSGVGKDQMEAAQSIGLSEFQSYTRIILPQALVGAVPNLSTNTVGLFKATCLLFVMSINDITGIARIEAGHGYRYIEAYTDLFIVYVVICMLMEKGFSLLEKRLRVFRAGK